MLYPVESVMQSGKLAALARGEVLGILGDTEVIGTAADQPGPPSTLPGMYYSPDLQSRKLNFHFKTGPGESQQAVAPGPSVPQAVPTASTNIQSTAPSVPEAMQPVVRAPFKLDLSDSEDDD